MVEQRETKASDVNWALTIANVQKLFEQWPANIASALRALEEKTGVHRSWYMEMGSRLQSAKLVKTYMPQKGQGERKRIDAQSLYLICLATQTLNSQGLLFAQTPRRNEVIREIITVMEQEGDNLCLE